MNTNQTYSKGQRVVLNIRGLPNHVGTIAAIMQKPIHRFAEAYSIHWDVLVPFGETNWYYYYANELKPLPQYESLQFVI